MTSCYDFMHLSQNIPLPQTVVELEAIAAKRALDFSLEFGFTKAILEGDSETVMKALQNDSPSFASFGLLITKRNLGLGDVCKTLL